MSNADSHLASMENAYTRAMIDVTAIREYLRDVRKRHFPNNRQAAKAAGMNASTVAKMENLKTWPKYDPPVGNLLKLLGAMDVSLTDFVTELKQIDQATTERSRNEVLHVTQAGAQDHATSARDEEAATATLEYVATRNLGERIRTLEQRITTLEEEAATARRGQASDRHAPAGQHSGLRGGATRRTTRGNSKGGRPPKR